MCVGNMVNAGALLEEKHPQLSFIRCKAHALQCLVKDILKIGVFERAYSRGKAANKKLRLIEFKKKFIEAQRVSRPDRAPAGQF